VRSVQIVSHNHVHRLVGSTQFVKTSILTIHLPISVLPRAPCEYLKVSVLEGPYAPQKRSRRKGHKLFLFFLNYALIQNHLFKKITTYSRLREINDFVGIIVHREHIQHRN
jgi:hypothetical protein